MFYKFVISSTRYDIALVFVLVTSITLAGLIQQASADSPSFPRQAILDKPEDWDFPNYAIYSSLRCNENTVDFPGPPDIQEINYLSDGKVLNATIWFSTPFQQPSMSKPG